jgi:hypothetical protein
VLRLVYPGDVVEADSLLLTGPDPPRRGTAEASEDPAPTRPRLATEQPDEEPDQEDRRQKAEHERDQQRPALVGRLGVDDHILLGEQPGELGWVDERGDLGLELGDRY